MGRDSKFNKHGQDLPKQEFNGKTYYLYPNERYYSKGCKRLHRVVWEFYNGKIPKGYHIHHVDNNTSNNAIENLNLVHASLHYRFSGKKRFKENPEFAEEFHSKGIEKAKEWHNSEEGLKWHSEHAKKTWINRKQYFKNCEVCGNQYQTPFPEKSKYCHDNCKAKALRKRRREND